MAPCVADRENLLPRRQEAAWPLPPCSECVTHVGALLGLAVVVPPLPFQYETRLQSLGTFCEALLRARGDSGFN